MRLIEGKKSPIRHNRPNQLEAFDRIKLVMIPVHPDPGGLRRGMVVTRDEIEAALRAAYAAREANDALAACKIFHPNAVYRVAGDPRFCSFAESFGGDRIPAAVEDLFCSFPVKTFDVVSMVIDVNRASVLIHGTFEFAATGEDVSSDIAHFWTFRDGRAAELVEFLDTAHLVHLVSNAHRAATSIPRTFE